ncbi:MAG: toxin-antitoxin system YwqK family antitoxin [Bacteroidales bacterium]
MYRYITVFILIIFSLTASGQNAFDENGDRTGPWKGVYPDGTLWYKGEFASGRPVGLMKRYDEEGNLSTIMNFYSESDRCFAEMYSKNGLVIAKGIYESQKKDSTWIYLGSDGNIRMVENYEMGRLDGPVEYYYPSGNLSQRLHYRSGKKEGPWIKFFENSDTMTVASYTIGMLHGDYFSYYPGGKISISGKYHNDLKDGNWSYFSEKGELVSVIKYDKGEVLNPDELEKSYERFIKTIEENEGNIPDPDSGLR